VHRDTSPHGRNPLTRHPARTPLACPARTTHSSVILREAKRSRRISRPFATLTALAVATAGVILGTTAALAPANATLTGFQAGNIMSDAVMGAANTMSVAQIQAFLDSKNACTKLVSSGNGSGIPVVATSASSAYLSTNSAVTYQITGGVPGTTSGTFLCLRNSTFDGQSAAQIIYDVSQQYQINPQVLIVLLEKEEGLITDTSPNSNQYQIAAGFGCPDTAACNTTYYGFKNQLSNAANLFKTVLNGGWSNYPAYTTVYVQYNPTASCGGSNVYISNYATSALYRYTPYQPNAAVLAAPPGTAVACGAYGNSNFYSFFTDWFGSTQTPTASVPLPKGCDSQVPGVGCVWRMQNPTTGAQLLTSSLDELTNAVNTLGWIYIGQAFYAFTSQVTGTQPVYRLNNAGQYVYTIDDKQKTNLVAAGATLEGTAFYAYPPSTTNNASYQVFQYTNASNQSTPAQTGTSDATTVTQSGFAKSSAAFNVPSSIAAAPLPANGQVNVYRLFGPEHFWTTSLAERDSLIAAGWTNEGVGFTASADTSATPVYRLLGPSGHFWTTNTHERDALVSSGWVNEGVGWYVDGATPAVYRLFNAKANQYLFTANVSEAAPIANTAWAYQGVAFGTDSTNVTNPPVYQMSSASQQFLTASAPEVLSIANRGYVYQGIAFTAVASGTGTPVARLFNTTTGEHFWTQSQSESAFLLTQGWQSEGTAWSVDSDSSGTPTYRLFNPSTGSHYWTPKTSQRDTLVAQGWSDEGIAWYT